MIAAASLTIAEVLLWLGTLSIVGFFVATLMGAWPTISFRIGYEYDDNKMSDKNNTDHK